MSTPQRQYPTYKTVGFTGTRNGMTKAQENTVQRLMCEFDPSRVHHGLCVGSDSMFDDLAWAYAIIREAHPGFEEGHPLRARFRNPQVVHPIKPPLDRNRDIVDASDVLIATPETAKEVQKSGTWATVRYARKQGKPRYIVLPNGEVDRDGDTPTQRRMKVPTQEQVNAVLAQLRTWEAQHSKDFPQWRGEYQQIGPYIAHSSILAKGGAGLAVWSAWALCEAVWRTQEQIASGLESYGDECEIWHNNEPNPIQGDIRAVVAQ